MKYIGLFFAMVASILVTTLSGCGPAEGDDLAEQQRQGVISNLTGGSARVWKLKSRTYNGVNSCISACELAYHKIRFQVSGQGQVAALTCLEDDCFPGEGYSSITVDPTTFAWMLENTGTLVIDGFFKMTILSLSATELKLETSYDDFKTVETFEVTVDIPFPTRSQMLAGSISRTWKYTKRLIDNVELPLTDCLLATRFTNFTNGNLNTFNQEGCGVSTTGTWRFEEAESIYVSQRSDGFTIRFNILELSNERLVIRYQNPQNQEVILHQEPVPGG